MADPRNDDSGGSTFKKKSKRNLNTCVSLSFKTLSDLVLWQCWGWGREGKDKAAGMEETFYY